MANYCRAGKQSLRGTIGLLYRPARLYRLAELIPWNQFLGSLKVYKFGLCRHHIYSQNIYTVGGINYQPSAVFDRDRLTRLNWTNITVYFSFICTLKLIYKNTPTVTQGQFWYALVAFSYRKMRHFTSFASSLRKKICFFCNLHAWCVCLSLL